MRSIIPIVSLVVAAAVCLSGLPALAEAVSRAPAALVPFPGSGTVKIQLAALPPFTAPEQSLPPNGHALGQTSAGPTAPLRILPSGDKHHYVKLEDNVTGNLVLTVFVRAGQQVDVRVPFGTYVVKYASGQKWYGYQHLFGPDAVYHKADSTFAFRREGNQIKGFSITLSATGGNTTASSINSNAF